MNNEPVVWIIDVKMTDCDDNFIWNTGNYPDWQVKDWLPLYTHPVKELDEQFKKGFEAGKEEGWKAHKFHHPAELTDEEINKTYLEKYDGHMGFLSPDEVRDFARAILRKAQGE